VRRTEQFRFSSRLLADKFGMRLSSVPTDHPRQLRKMRVPLARARSEAPERTEHLRYKTDQGHALQHAGTLMVPELWSTHDDAICPGKRVGSWISAWQFLSSYQKEEMSLSDLCREFGVSRPPAIDGSIDIRRSGRKGCLTSAASPTAARTRPQKLRRTRSLPFGASTQAGEHGSLRHAWRSSNPT